MIFADFKSSCPPASYKNQFQIASRKFFQNKSLLNKIDITLNKYVPDAYNVYHGECI